jgi:hypothetical protein
MIGLIIVLVLLLCVLGVLCVVLLMAINSVAKQIVIELRTTNVWLRTLTRHTMPLPPPADPRPRFGDRNPPQARG